MSDRERLRDPMRVAAAMIVNSLVHQEYTSVARMTGGRFLSARDLERIVAKHAQTLIAPPDEAYENLRIVQESDAPPTFRIIIPLWSEEYIVSDLVLELRMIETYPGVVDVEVISLKPPPPEDLTLTDDELQAVADFVRALVEHDDDYLRASGAYDYGDPYAWTRNYGRWGDVDLVMPPGDPQTWISYAVRAYEDTRTSVGVVMWTEEEGRSDLTLELDLESRSDGTMDARFRGLHVM
jgi:hypothetical protein